jgi:hypothetical protein
MSVTTWLYNEFTKISTGIIFLTQLLVHWEDIIDRFAGWFKLSHLIERRNKHMNVLTLLTEGPAVLTDLLTAVGKIQSDLPQFQKTAADLKQAIADKSDPVKISADLEALLADLEADMQDLAALIPAPPAPSVAA